MKQYYVEFVKRVMVEPRKNAWNYTLETDSVYLEAFDDNEAVELLECLYSVKEVLKVELV
jgi:hypothetical protein